MNVLISKLNKNIGKYCSRQCVLTSSVYIEKRKKIKPYWLGRKRSEETIAKIKLTNEGKRYSPKTEFKKEFLKKYGSI